VRRTSPDWKFVLTSSSVLTLNVRHHIVTTVVETAPDVATMTIYIDGMKKEEMFTGWEPYLLTRSKCYISKAGWDNGGYLNGTVSSLKLYAGAMTQAQVEAAYNASFAYPTPAPTPYPTPAPTPYPTPAPTPSPTDPTPSPTPYPTPAPTNATSGGASDDDDASGASNTLLYAAAALVAVVALAAIFRTQSEPTYRAVST
jgi:hypothetical protein